MVDPKVVSVASQVQAAIEAAGQKAFLCFGSLLFFIRDQVFSTDTDIDIGIIGDPISTMRAFTDQGSFIPVHVVRDDVTKELYQATFRSKHGVMIDLFFWKKRDGFWYHCYNQSLVFSESGILNEYTFKGIPAHCIDVSNDVIREYMKDIRYRGITSYGTILKPLPQDPTAGVTLPVPIGYGACLDHFYPDWVEKRPQFGVSMAAHTFTVKTCRGISWEK